MKITAGHPGLPHAPLINRSRSAPAAVPSARSHPLAALVTVVLAALLLWGQCGCVAAKYQLVNSDTPLQVVNVDFPGSAPLQATLFALISYDSPSSWKREALWDEHVVALHNSGAQPIIVESVTLADSAGVIFTPGGDPWVLEKQSKAVEKKYRASGKACVRSAGPGVLIVVDRMNWNCVPQTRGVTT